MSVREVSASKFVKYLRNQIEVLEAFVEDLEDGHIQSNTVLHINLDELNNYLNCQLNIVPN